MAVVGVGVNLAPELKGVFMFDPSLDNVEDLPTNGSMMPSKRKSAADPHGRAALLLVESLIHSLVDKAVITRGEAIDIIDIAADVEAALSTANDDEGTSDASLLAPLASTFRIS